MLFTFNAHHKLSSLQILMKITCLPQSTAKILKVIEKRRDWMKFSSFPCMTYKGNISSKLSRIMLAYKNAVLPFHISQLHFEILQRHLEKKCSTRKGMDLKGNM